MENSQLKLICVPYAGGSASIYFKWKNLLQRSGIELVAPELAGRGRRLHEAFYSSIKDAAGDLYFQLLPALAKGNYSIFGHSMGSLIAFELLNKIRESKLPMPQHIFFSGRIAPHMTDPGRLVYHKLEDADFIREIVRLGGTSSQVFDDPDLKALFIPILRNDLRITETYLHENRYDPFPVNISVFIGKTEEATGEQITGWKEYAGKNFDIHYFNGGHFFLNDQYPVMIKVMEQLLGVSQLI